MAEELRVILKAKELAKHTLIITSNCNRYPKKYRFSLVDKMQNKALEIYEHLYEANRTDLRLYPKERSELQTKAILFAVKTVVLPSGNINNNNCNNSNGVRPFCVKQAVRVGIKPKSAKDTKKQMTFPKRINTKEFLLWIKILYAIFKIYTKHTEKRNLVRNLIEVVQDFKQ